LPQKARTHLSATQIELAERMGRSQARHPPPGWEVRRFPRAGDQAL